MASRLSFAIAINLLTENFKKGTSHVKSGLRSMQMHVVTFAAALGAGGIGLSNFVSRLIDVSRETGRVTTALKNVSGGTEKFAENQRFVIDMANKYGLEVNALTGNFAKFTASASLSGMAMSEQQKVFESVSRACTAFGMSADDSNSVFLALSQMMSKGKISSEELRLQMGERLPVALQAMAKAAGVSVADLDKLMKQGKLMSADMIPKFAEALNGMIPDVDTDNVETSVNRMKNAFTDFTKGTGVQNAYKALIDWITNAISTAADNLKNIVIGVLSVIAGFAYKSAAKIVVAWGASAAQMTAFAETANNRAQTSTARRVAAEQALEKAKLQQALAVGSQKVKAAEAVAKAETRLATATAAEVKATDIAKAASAKAAAVASTTAWGRAGVMLKIGAAKLIVSLKAMWSAFAPMIIISAIAAIVGKFIEMYDEAKRIRSIFSDYKKESQLSGYTQEVVALKQQLKIMNDKKQSQENINGAQAQLQKMLGVEHKSQKELNDLVAKRVELLKETAKADFHARKIVESSEALRDVGNKKYDGKLVKDMAPDWAMSRGDLVNEEKFKAKYNVKMTDGLGFENGLQNDLNSYIEQSKIWKHSSAELEKSTLAANKITDTTDGGGGGGGGGKESSLQKAEEKYAQSIRELNARAEVEKLTKNQYNKALDELNASALIDAKASGDKTIAESEYCKTLQKAVDQPLYSPATGELEKVQADHAKKLAELTAQKENGIISEQKYKEELRKLTIETAKAAGSIEGIGLEGKAYIEEMQFNAKMLEPDLPKMEKRDTTFDYKKSKADIAGEELDVARKNLESIKDAASGSVEDFTVKLNEAMQNVTNLEDALKIAVVMEDVEKLKEELNEGLYSGVKDIAGSADRVVNAFSNLRDVMNDVDATGWEKIMAIWSALTNVIDSFLSICKMVEAMTELTNRLAEAKKKESLMDTIVTQTKVTNSAIGAAATLTAAGVEKTAAEGEVAANTAKGASEAGASAAKLPFPWNIVAIGGAIAAAIAAFAIIPKFATGGIYTGGTSSGDKGLARLNKGEMILNHGQQSRLFDAINSGKIGGSNHITVGFDGFNVRGDKMELAINNSRKSRGKKPL